MVFYLLKNGDKVISLKVSDGRIWHIGAVEFLTSPGACRAIWQSRDHSEESSFDSELGFNCALLARCICNQSTIGI
jgi:hypothetical protein